MMKTVLCKKEKNGIGVVPRKSPEVAKKIVFRFLHGNLDLNDICYVPLIWCKSVWRRGRVISSKPEACEFAPSLLRKPFFFSTEIILFCDIHNQILFLFSEEVRTYNKMMALSIHVFFDFAKNNEKIVWGHKVITIYDLPFNLCIYTYYKCRKSTHHHHYGHTVLFFVQILRDIFSPM